MEKQLKLIELSGHWLIQRSTAAFPALTLIIANAPILILLNILLFWHIHVGIEEILADYVHHEVTRNWILILLRILSLVIIKDVFVFFVLSN
uniref:Succinate dehydrogenase cytochrome subunit 4 n=1 Tax=Psilotum nudum TaxID=3240 RepID=A0A1B3TRJ4_PSINU|nr:succinate dehydrogenase cytochrome subunit 4 [Psilotum nudum]AOH05934.1 succinate dehydrogenase cytochrome subunit 4 [Psilotum nudum]